MSSIPLPQLGLSPKELLQIRDKLTSLLQEPLTCHSILTYLSRAGTHLLLSYPDLCAGDAYRALTLIDYANERIWEWEDEVDEEDPAVRIGEGAVKEVMKLLNAGEEQFEDLVQPFLQQCQALAQCFAGHGLRKSGCARDAAMFINMASDGLEELVGENQTDVLLLPLLNALAPEAKWKAKSLKGRIQEWHKEELQCLEAEVTHAIESKSQLGWPNHYTATLAEKLKLLTRLPCGPEPQSGWPRIYDGEQGYCRREVYPWNTFEPDRLSDENIAELNEHMTRCSQGRVRVGVSELPTLEDGESDDGKPRTNKQLGVYATRDIYPGEQFFQETSFLIGVRDPFSGLLCEFCSRKIYEFSVDRKQGEAVYEQKREKVHCPDCLAPPVRNDDSDSDDYGSSTDEDSEDGIPTYCSEACLQKALETYHRALCHHDLTWLYNEVKSSPSARAMWLLMLLKSFGASIARVSGAVPTSAPAHPLLMPEVKSAWGAYYRRNFDTSEHKAPTHLLPFTFALQIQHPLRMLLSLKVDPFAPEYVDKFDTWVISTLYAKFLGTASSRLAFGVGDNPSRNCFARHNAPEVVACHLGWSLVNHSCEPNAVWECEGTIAFRGREGKEISVKAGEEIVHCYCDVDLSVEERRAWMHGSLGGDCMCERCQREEREVGVEGQEMDVELTN